MTTKERIAEFGLPEIAWQKNLPMEIFEEMESDGWKCYDIYTSLRLAKDFGSSEYKFVVHQTSVSAQIPPCYDISKFPLHISNMQCIQKWAKQLEKHLAK